MLENYFSIIVRKYHFKNKNISDITKYMFKKFSSALIKYVSLKYLRQKKHFPLPYVYCIDERVNYEGNGSLEFRLFSLREKNLKIRKKKIKQ